MDFIVRAGYLVFTLGGCKGFGPKQIIVNIQLWLQRAIFGSYKYLRDREKIRSGDIKREKVVGVTVGDELSQNGKDIAIIIIMC